MAPKKGQGKSKGKQPARQCTAPQILPPQSSSDKENWPIWEQLQTKTVALEAERAAQGSSKPSEQLLHHSARESKSHKHAKPDLVRC